MKEKILQALKNKYRNLGFSEKVFDGAAAYIEPSIKEESEIEAAINGVEPLFKIFQSETDSVRTAKSVAEKRIAELEEAVKRGGEQPKEPATKQAVADEPPAWARTLIEDNKKLNERFAAFEGEKRATTRKQRLESVIGKLPEPLRKGYGRTEFKELTDDQFNSLLTEIETEVDGIAKEVGKKGVVFSVPVNNNGEQNGEKLTKAQLEAITKRGAMVGKDEQPF